MLTVGAGLGQALVYDCMEMSYNKPQNGRNHIDNNSSNNGKKRNIRCVSVCIYTHTCIYIYTQRYKHEYIHDPGWLLPSIASVAEGAGSLRGLPRCGLRRAPQKPLEGFSLWGQVAEKK